MRTGSLRIFRIAGIDVYVHVSWLVVFALVTWSLAVGYYPPLLPALTAAQAWTLGAISAILLFAVGLRACSRILPPKDGAAVRCGVTAQADRHRYAAERELRNGSHAASVARPDDPPKSVGLTGRLGDQAGSTRRRAKR